MEKKLVVVTGAGSGIGRAIVVRLALAGHSCILVGRTRDRLDETAKLLSEPDGDHVVCPADLTTDVGRNAVVEAIDAHSQALSGLVNNAGGSYVAPLFKQDLGAWRQNFALNVESAAFLSFAAMERMCRTGGGAIVNIGSVYGQVGLNDIHYQARLASDGPCGPERAVSYAAAKGAVSQMTRELAVAGGKMGIRVNTVSPGMIDVEKHGLSPDEAQTLAAGAPMGRLGLPTEVAAVVEFLLSESASFVTGVDLAVDGGWTTW